MNRKCWGFKIYFNIYLKYIKIVLNKILKYLFIYFRLHTDSHSGAVVHEFNGHVFSTEQCPLSLPRLSYFFFDPFALDGVAFCWQKPPVF